MLYASLLFFLLLPLLGVMAMEAGGDSPFIDAAGAPNGASIAYAAHVVAFFVGFTIVTRISSASNSRASESSVVRSLDQNLDAYSWFCALVFLVLAVLMLFAYGGLDVLLLKVDKAQFRVSLGPFGAIMTIATKWLMPAMFAALVFALKNSFWTTGRRIRVAIAAFCLCVVGASWGFKTTVFFMLLPAMILNAWTIRLRTLLVLAVCGCCLVFGAGLYFDKSQDTSSAIQFLILRITSLQGDLAWYTWDRVSSGHETPAYWATFLPVFGDRVLEALTGANATANYAFWARFHFGTAMTIWGGYPAEGVEAGVTNQATLFAESLVVGGSSLFLAVSTSFGMLTGAIANLTRNAVKNVRPETAATLATFFSLTVIPWTLGNGLASLVYLINVVGAATSFMTIAIFFAVRNSRA